MTLNVKNSYMNVEVPFKKSKVQSSLYVNEENVCPVCGSKLETDFGRAEVSCTRCGLVVEENLVDMGPEWRAFDHEQRDKRVRVGAPKSIAIHDGGLQTVIDWRNKDSHGRSIPMEEKSKYYRLRKWQRRIRVSGSGERNLAFALSEIDRNSSNLGLPRSIRDDSCSIYRNAVKHNLIRGRSIDCVVAASIYTACRRCNIPRTLDEISEVSKVSKKRIGKTYRFLSRKLNIRLKPTSPSDYIPRFATNLGLSAEVQSKAIDIINKSVEEGLICGKNPSGIAAASLYIASILLGERITQKDIAKITGVTEVTIRNRYKELSELNSDIFL